MTKVIGAKVAAGVVHLHTISDVTLANKICDAYDRPVVWIINGERVEYTLEDLTAELARRGGYAETIEPTAEKTSFLGAVRELRIGDTVLTPEHGVITVTERTMSMRGSNGKSVVTGVNNDGKTVYWTRSSFSCISITR